MFGRKLKELREAKSLSMDKLVELYNQKFDAKMNKSTLSRYENEIQDPIYTVVVNLAKLFEVSVDYLSGNIEAFDMGIKEIGTPYNPIVHKIPVLGYISAGLPIYADEHIVDYTYTDLNGGAEYFALKVKGDSMNAARINDGDLVIVRVQPRVENGEIAVVRVNDDDATVKRYKQEDNWVQLIPQSFNPEHDVQLYNLENTHIEVVGKVVECKVKF